MKTKITADQQKVIDLIKTGTIQNQKIAFDLNYGQKLGVELIYSELYEKYKVLYEGHPTTQDLMHCFPLLAAKENLLSKIKHIKVEELTLQGIGYLNLLKDIAKFFPNFKDFCIRPVVELESNEYKKKLDIQVMIHKETGIPIEDISVQSALF